MIIKSSARKIVFFIILSNDSENGQNRKFFAFSISFQELQEF